MKKGLMGFFGLVLLGALAACSTPNRTYSYSLNEKDLAMINTLFDDAPTYCLGRYTFNYPKALTQELSSIIKIDEMSAVDSLGQPINFLLTDKRDAAAAPRFFRKSPNNSL